VGDTLLVQGQWTALDAHVPSDPAVLVVDAPQRVRRQAVPLGPRSRPAAVIVAAMVALMATGAVPAVVAGLGAAAAMVLLRVLTVDQVYRGVNWTTVVLVGAMMPLSTAMTKTGAAERVATGLVDIIGDRGPYALLVGLFLLTAVMGQLISNMATALIVIPIGISAAVELDVSPRPVMMCITVAAAAALLTPVATPANLMVMGPGGYEFGDYWKLGLPLLVLYLAVAVGLVPLLWGF
jgi:di/tricarboxylate transporter